MKSTEGTLSQKVVRSGFWVFFLRIINQGFSLLRLIILARLLLPNDFGIMGIALLVMSILETFTQAGFEQALIQKKEDIYSYLDCTWTFLMIRGIVLYGILYLIAPYAALFFDSPEAGPIIRAIGVLLIFKSFTNIGIIYFRKELNFYKEFIYQFSGTIVDFIVAVIAVLTLRNVWALVLGQIAGSFVRFIVSYLVQPYKPKINFDFGKAKELFGFGKWIMGSSILVFLITHGDDIFVGKLLGATMLGFYQMAYRISNMPATEITHVISQVTFPAYSKLQDNIPKLREAYLRTLQLTALLSFPIAGLIFILAPDFTMIFLGEKWMPMVPAMQVLCLFGVIRSFGATTGPLFQGVGKPGILTKLAVLQLIMLAGIIYPLTAKWGILGTSAAVVIPNFCTQWLAALKIMKIIEARTSNIFRLLALPAVGAIGMVLGLWFIHPIANNIFSFLGLILLGAFVYLAIIFIMDKKFDLGYKAIINQIRGTV